MGEKKANQTVVFVGIDSIPESLFLQPPYQCLVTALLFSLVSQYSFYLVYVLLSGESLGDIVEVGPYLLGPRPGRNGIGDKGSFWFLKSTMCLMDGSIGIGKVVVLTVRLIRPMAQSPEAFILGFFG